MGQEFAILIKGIVLSVIWLYFDYQFYKRLGISPIFGSLKQETISKKIGVFAYGISFHFLLLSVLILLYYKFTGKLAQNFSNIKLSIGLICGAAILNLLSRVAVSFCLRKQDEGASLLFNGAITFGIIVIILIGLYVAGFL